MLITFKSPAAADILMFGDNAKEILRILGKDPEGRQGIVTVEQLPEAIARLHGAIEQDRARHTRSGADEEAEREAGQVGIAAPVNLAQRAYPLLEMLQYAQKEEVPVTWDS